MHDKAYIRIDRLFGLARRAKRARVYEVANKIFFHLVKDAIEENYTLNWRIETDNRFIFPNHRDLFVIYGKYCGWYLNIPVPLILPHDFPELFDPHEDRFVDRTEHKRPRLRRMIGRKREIYYFKRSMQELIF